MKLLLALVAILPLSISAQELPIRLKVGTYNVGHFNQGNIGGFQGGQPAAEVMRWRAWIGSQSLDILGVNEWNKGFDKDSTLNAEEQILKPFYNNIYMGDRRTWIYNGMPPTTGSRTCAKNTGLAITMRSWGISGLVARPSR